MNEHTRPAIRHGDLDGKLRMRARLTQIIDERFAVGHMSDTKWGRLLDALATEDALVPEVSVKWAWDQTIRSMSVAGAERNFDDWSVGIEGLISGRPRGWYAYREIEWLRFDSAVGDSEKVRSHLKKEPAGSN